MKVPPLKLPPKVDIDGTDAGWLLTFAKRQLDRFKKLFPLGVRRFNLPDGEEVTIWWGNFRDRIRIVAAAVAFGFIQASKTGPSQRIRGVINRRETDLIDPSYPASSIVTPYGSSAPVWNRDRTTAVFNDAGGEGPNRVYRAGAVYEPEWDTPPQGPGFGSTSLVYMSTDGRTVVFSRTWGDVLTSGQPALVYNRLEWDDETDPENPTWEETYFNFDCADIADLISSPPGSTIYEAGNGLTAPHWLLEIDPEFPGTITGGEETYRVASYSPYRSLQPGQVPGQSDHILLKLDFAVPASATLIEAGYTWSNTNEGVDPPTHNDPGHVLARFAHYEVVYSTYSVFYSLNLLTGVTTLVRFNESELTRNLWLRAMNDQGDGDPEEYPNGIELQQKWDDVDTVIYSGKFGTINPENVSLLLTPDYFQIAPVGNINFGGSAMFAFLDRELDIPSVLDPTWAHQSTITSDYFLWTSSTTFIVIEGFQTNQGDLTLSVYRDVFLQTLVEVNEVTELSVISAFPLPEGAMSGITYTDDANATRALREYLNWDSFLLPELAVIQVQNSATGKYQHEEITDIDIPETEYVMYESQDIVHSFTAEQGSTIMPDAEDDEKWYIKRPDEPEVLREYTRTEDPDTLELVVDYVELTFPTELTFDSLTFPDNAFVRPFSTMGEGRAS